MAELGSKLHSLMLTHSCLPHRGLTSLLLWILLMERPMDPKKKKKKADLSLLAWDLWKALELTQMEREKMGGAVQEPTQLLR